MLNSGIFKIRITYKNIDVDEDDYDDEKFIEFNFGYWVVEKTTPYLWFVEDSYYV